MLTPQGHRRRILLFVVAIFVPALGLVALTVRMSRQESELRQTRRAEELKQSVAQTRQLLLGRLESIKSIEVAAVHALAPGAELTVYHDPAVVLAARVEKENIILPWESGGAAPRFRAMLAEGEFARSIRQGEREEFVQRRLDSAAAHYRTALLGERSVAQKGHAQLWLARVLANDGRKSEALSLYTAVFALSSSIVDQDGMPLAFYAAGSLLEEADGRQRALSRLRNELDSSMRLSPVALYRLSDIARQLAQTGVETEARDAAAALEFAFRERALQSEQALALEREFPRLRFTEASRDASPAADSVWIPFGDEKWLVGISRPSGKLSSVLVAVRASVVLSSLASDGSRAAASGFAAGDGGEGELLGHNFPGLRLRIPASSDSESSTQGIMQFWFYPAVLLLVLSVTLFGSYLLWRDVRREVHLADLRSQFVASVSHELKTPLTAIRMFAETLRMGRPSDARSREEYLDTIVTESERLTRLLNNVLEFSKIEQGTARYNLVPTSLPDVVSSAVRAVEHPLAQDGFEFRVEAVGDIAPVKADRDALQQAILNLLSNAMKYSGRSRVIELRVRQQDSQAVIQVADHGIGIAAEEHGRIFEKFYRAPTSESKLIAGAGLGLTLVEHVAKAHGGHVEVISAPGQGSTFSIHLPLIS